MPSNCVLISRALCTDTIIRVVALAWIVPKLLLQKRVNYLAEVECIHDLLRNLN